MWWRDDSGGCHHWRSLTSYAQTNAGNDVWPWAVPLVEWAFGGVLVASTAALPPLRRRFYAVFLALHLLVMPAFILAALDIDAEPKDRSVVT